jgi:hypothetical protein
MFAPIAEFNAGLSFLPQFQRAWSNGTIIAGLSNLRVSDVVAIPLGSLRLSVYRLLPLLAFISFLVWWIKENAARIRLAGAILPAFCIWCSLSPIVIYEVKPSFGRTQSALQC